MYISYDVIYIIYDMHRWYEMSTAILVLVDVPKALLCYAIQGSTDPVLVYSMTAFTALPMTYRAYNLTWITLEHHLVGWLDNGKGDDWWTYMYEEARHEDEGQTSDIETSAIAFNSSLTSSAMTPPSLQTSSYRPQREASAKHRSELTSQATSGPLAPSPSFYGSQSVVSAKDGPQALQTSSYRPQQEASAKHGSELTSQASSGLLAPSPSFYGSQSVVNAKESPTSEGQDEDGVEGETQGEGEREKRRRAAAASACACFASTSAAAVAAPLTLACKGVSCVGSSTRMAVDAASALPLPPGAVRAPPKLESGASNGPTAQKGKDKTRKRAPSEGDRASSDEIKVNEANGGALYDNHHLMKHGLKSPRVLLADGDVADDDDEPPLTFYEKGSSQSSFYIRLPVGWPGKEHHAYLGHALRKAEIKFIAKVHKELKAEEVASFYEGHLINHPGHAKETQKEALEKSIVYVMFLDREFIKKVDTDDEKTYIHCELFHIARKKKYQIVPVALEKQYLDSNYPWSKNFEFLIKKNYHIIDMTDALLRLKTRLKKEERKQNRKQKCHELAEVIKENCDLPPEYEEE